MRQINRLLLALTVTLVVTWVPLQSLVITTLEAYYELNEASGNAIDAHDVHDLTDTNTVGASASTPCRVGNARDFERDNSQYFVIADNADLSFGNEDFTVWGWMQLESKPASVDLSAIQKTTGGTGEYFLQYRNNDGTDRFAFAVFGSAAFGDFGLVTADNLGSPSTGTCYFVVGWHDSVNDVIGIQVNNGTANTVAHTAGVFDGTGDFTISGFEFSNFWDGLLDEMGVARKVLTTGEKDFLWNGGSGRSYSDIQNEGGGGGGGTCRAALLLRGAGNC